MITDDYLQIRLRVVGDHDDGRARSRPEQGDSLKGRAISHKLSSSPSRNAWSAISLPRKSDRSRSRDYSPADRQMPVAAQRIAPQRQA